MSVFLYVNDEETRGKVNIDELYDKSQQRDLKQLAIFNKILNRVHKRITTTARNKRNDKHIWFLVPEYIFGEPIYDQGECIAYLVVKLEENGFYVRYMHPNTLFVSWNNWVPSYVRNEIKKKTGIVLDEKGNIIKKEDELENDPNSNILNDKTSNLQKPGKLLGYKMGDFPNSEFQAKKLLTLPVHQFLTRKDLLKIVNLINKFYAK
jgi:hypothetical protein